MHARAHTHARTHTCLKLLRVVTKRSESRHEIFTLGYFVSLANYQLLYEWDFRFLFLYITYVILRVFRDMYLLLLCGSRVYFLQFFYSYFSLNFLFYFIVFSTFFKRTLTMYFQSFMLVVFHFPVAFYSQFRSYIC